MPRVRRRRALPTPLVVAVCAVVLSACGGSGGSSSGGPTSTSTSRGNLAGEFRLGEPLGYLNELARRSEVLFNAVEERIQACMEDRGFRYETMSMADPGGKGIAQLAMEARQQDPDEVVGYGFSEWNAAQPALPAVEDTAETVDGADNSDIPPAPDDPNAWVYELPEDEQAAWRDALQDLDAPPEEMESATIDEGSIAWAPDACLTKGREAVYGPLDAWWPAFFMVTGDIPAEGEKEVLATPGVQEAIDTWATCMKTAGFDVNNLEDPLRQLSFRFPPGTDAAESAAVEAEMAPVDARCFQDADLPTILGNAQRQVEAELLEEHEGVITAYVELYDAALARARGEG